MSEEYKDDGPFVMSRYLNKEDLYAAMADRIERLESEKLEYCESTTHVINDLTAERDRMKKELWFARKAASECRSDFETVNAYFKDVCEERDRMKKALEFYADKNSWTVDEDYQGYRIDGIITSSDVESIDGEMIEFGGKRAREALKP
jgi:uncharacterized protein (UPF0335 family)